MGKKQKAKQALRSQLSQQDIALGKKRIYLLLVMIAVGLIVAAYHMHNS
jgi:hypothetical protein